MELATVLKLLVTTMMVILLLLTSHRGAAVHGAISLMEGNGTATTNIICTGECLVADQYAELELYMMAYETSRILQGPRRITPPILAARNHVSCARRSWPSCAGLRTRAPPGENCNTNARYNRLCSRAR